MSLEVSFHFEDTHTKAEELLLATVPPKIEECIMCVFGGEVLLSGLRSVLSRCLSLQEADPMRSDLYWACHNYMISP